MKCKNIDCDNETNGKNLYCSLSCRNIYVNKYLRDYTKISGDKHKIGKSKKDEYLINPKKCKKCKNIITYEKRENDFCNRSCSTSYTNLNREYNWSTSSRNGVKNYLLSKGMKVEFDESGEYHKNCKNCNKEFTTIKKDKKYCSKECIYQYKSKDTDEYQKYRNLSRFKFALNDYPEEFEFSLIEKHGWYSPTNKNNNLGGVSRDHILSVKEGFELGIDPKIISHPANCRLMIHTDNISKNKKSNITLEIRNKGMC